MYLHAKTSYARLKDPGQSSVDYGSTSLNYPACTKSVRVFITLKLDKHTEEEERREPNTAVWGVFASRVIFEVF